MTTETNGDTVRYTVKELLAEIRNGIAEIRTVANQHDSRLTRLEERQQEHTTILQTVNPQLVALQKIIDTQADVKAALSDDHQSAFTRRDRLFAMACTCIVVALSVATNGAHLFHL